MFDPLGGGGAAFAGTQAKTASLDAITAHRVQAVPDATGYPLRRGRNTGHPIGVMERAGI